MDIVLTENFRLSEFAVSEEYPEMAAAIEFSDVETERIRFACAAFLQPLRTALGPVKILSGKRTPELNAVVGGALNSGHLYGLNPQWHDAGAADFTVPGRTPLDVAEWFIAYAPPFRLLVYYPERNFAHLSFPDSSGEYGRIVEER